MCVICASNFRVRQPSKAECEIMFNNNPHGAGFMYASNNHVFISKGYTDFPSFWKAVESHNFNEYDAVVYHFRISTQAGITKEMTQPFPLARNLEEMRYLSNVCDCGIAHNGIIRLTSNGNKTYSDTALFIAYYMSYMVRSLKDLKDQRLMESLEELTCSKLAILVRNGYIATVGNFINDDGLLFSNSSYKNITYQSRKPSRFHRLTADEQYILAGVDDLDFYN